MARAVLIISLPEDVHARSVAKEVEAAGGEAVVLDSAAYPGSWALSQRFDSSGAERFSVSRDGRVVPETELAGVWWRRPREHEIPGEVVDPEIRRFCGQEARAAFRGWLVSLGSRVINSPAAEASANCKPHQLALAAKAGLTVPPTLVTNDPGEARRFAAGLGGPVVFKILTNTSWQFAETRELRPEHDGLLDGLRRAPAIFQSLVPGLDIRATVVDGRVFPVSIASKHPGASLDWRLDGAARTAPHEMPRAVADALARLVAALGLRYGAADLRLTPDGTYHFLEVNPSGQFLFCDIHAGQTISAALARALLGGAVRPG